MANSNEFTGWLWISGADSSISIVTLVSATTTETIYVNDVHFVTAAADDVTIQLGSKVIAGGNLAANTGYDSPDYDDVFEGARGEDLTLNKTAATTVDYRVRYTKVVHPGQQWA